MSAYPQSCSALGSSGNQKQAITAIKPTGRALFGVVGVVAELERKVIRDRVTVGRAVLKATR